MKLKSVLCAVLTAALLLGCLTGCAGVAEPVPGSEPAGTREPRIPLDEPARAVLLSAAVNAKALGFSAFDNQLVEFLKQTGRAEENFTVSPLSFKAALTLAALGAEGETLDQLLRALGYSDLDALRAWYATVRDGLDRFENLSRLYGSEENAYRVVNSVWSNQDQPGEFRPGYLEDVAAVCRAEADSARGAKLAGAVNDWVKKQTEGLIPSLLDDPSAVAEISAILVNALYLKTGWQDEFTKLGDRDFTAVSGETVQKPFIGQTAELRYYGDEETQLVVLPLQGGVSMVFVLGDDAGLADKLAQAEYRSVEVSIPMFDVETTFDQEELMDYLKLLGCDRMFSDVTAEFGPMYTEDLYVVDIIQKAKVHVDETGLEAAAATAIVMDNKGIAYFEEAPVVFCADRPFSFYVLQEGETPELLFWGQIVR